MADSPSKKVRKTSKSEEDETFKVKNWKKLAPADLKKMSSQERSRYNAYEDPPKTVSDAQASSRRRLNDDMKHKQRSKNDEDEDEAIERERHAMLIGQLKAAESRNRLRIMRLRYESNRAQEIGHLIACQPNALKAVRLQALVPPYKETDKRRSGMDKLERERVERLLEDTQGLLTNRIS